MPKTAKRFSDDVMLSLVRSDRQAVIPGLAESAKAESSGKFRVRPMAVPE
jgi:hypothetical protein